MISELSAKHNEFVSQLKTEVSLELRESMEAAHQAELQQVQVYYMQTHKPKHYSFSQPLLFFYFFFKYSKVSEIYYCPLKYWLRFIISLCFYSSRLKRPLSLNPCVWAWPQSTSLILSALKKTWNRSRRLPSSRSRPLCRRNLTRKLHSCRLAISQRWTRSRGRTRSSRRGCLSCTNKTWVITHKIISAAQWSSFFSCLCLSRPVSKESFLVCSEEMKEQWETRVAQERASMDEKQAKEIQVKFHYKKQLLYKNIIQKTAVAFKNMHCLVIVCIILFHSILVLFCFRI